MEPVSSSRLRRLGWRALFDDQLVSPWRLEPGELTPQVVALARVHGARSGAVYRAVLTAALRLDAAERLVASADAHDTESHWLAAVSGAAALLTDAAGALRAVGFAVPTAPAALRDLDPRAAPAVFPLAVSGAASRVARSGPGAAADQVAAAAGALRAALADAVGGFGPTVAQRRARRGARTVLALRARASRRAAAVVRRR